MPDGGTLTIKARGACVADGQMPGIAGGDYVCLGVSDTGIGMDDATRQRAIEPFFSTKGVGKGTGLGLSMVHGLVAQLGGGLTIESAPGAGTSIDLWLPISLAEAIVPDTLPAEPSRAPKACGTALLVEDEELVRMSTADMLSHLGYEVAEACSAEEALRLVAEGLCPDLLVTDHLMPCMSGAQLARELQSSHPGLPVLIVSGYAEADGIASDLPRLTKPFRHDELAASLSALPASARYE
jgi:CheY-like chemotaxis protein